MRNFETGATRDRVRQHRLNLIDIVESLESGETYLCDYQKDMLEKFLKILQNEERTKNEKI